MLGHELTHIRNGDVRMMVIAVIIAGAISFFAELLFRLWFYGGFRGARSSDDRRGGGAGLAILIAIGFIVVAYLLSFVIRLALSRSREFLADAGSVELTKNPDAMISALRKIEGRGELPGATSAVMEMCIDNPREGIRRIVRHPSDGGQPGRGVGQIRRRPRSRPDRLAAASRQADGEPGDDPAVRRAVEFVATMVRGARWPIGETRWHRHGASHRSPAAERTLRTLGTARGSQSQRPSQLTISACNYAKSRTCCKRAHRILRLPNSARGV